MDGVAHRPRMQRGQMIQISVVAALMDADETYVFFGPEGEMPDHGELSHWNACFAAYGFVFSHI